MLPFGPAGSAWAVRWSLPHLQRTLAVIVVTGAGDRFGGGTAIFLRNVASHLVTAVNPEHVANGVQQRDFIVPVGIDAILHVVDHDVEPVAGDQKQAGVLFPLTGHRLVLLFDDRLVIDWLCPLDRQSVVEVKSVSVRVDSGGGRIDQKKKKQK